MTETQGLEGCCGAYRRAGRGSTRHASVIATSGVDDPATDNACTTATLPPLEYRMLLGSLLQSFILISFVHAQLLTQDSMDLELKMMSVTETGPDDHLGHVPLDVENYPVAPPTLQLEQVQVFIRHGMF